MKFKAVFLFAAVLSMSCETLSKLVQQPKVSFKKAQYRAADFEKLGVDVFLTVSNPNPIGIQLAGYSIDFQVDGVPVMKDTVRQSVDLRPNKVGQVKLPLVLSWQKIISKIQNTSKVPADLPWIAKGKVSITTPIGPISIPFNVDGLLPVIQPPLIKPVMFKVSGVSPTGMSATVNFDVVNQGGRVLDLGSLKHDLLIQGQSILSGNMSPGAVKANGKKTQKLSTKLSFLGAAASIYKIVTSGQKVQVRLKGSTDVDTGFGIVPMTFDSSQGLKVLGL